MEFLAFTDEDDLAYRARFCEKRSPLKSHIKFTRNDRRRGWSCSDPKSVRKCTRRTERPMIKFGPRTIGVIAAGRIVFGPHTVAASIHSCVHLMVTRITTTAIQTVLTNEASAWQPFIATGICQAALALEHCRSCCASCCMAPSTPAHLKKARSSGSSIQFTIALTWSKYTYEAR
jgi:hypothetical protein